MAQVSRSKLYGDLVAGRLFRSCRRLKLTGSILTGLALTMLLGGCGQQKVPSGLVYCSEGNPESFNPQLVTSGTTIDATSHQIYSRLVDYDPESGDIIPALATEWQISEDGLSYEFELRQGTQFHDLPYFHPSRHFNADDVLFSFNRIIDKQHPFHEVAQGGYPFFQSIGFAGLIKSISKQGEYRVRFELTQPDASFLSNLATDFAVILSKEYADQLLAQGSPQQLDNQPIGTGPFMLVQYVKNEYIRYRRHPGYWGNMPQSEMLVFDITPRSTTRLAKLITGDCSVSALPKAGELPVIEQHDNLVLESRPGMNVAYWAFNTQKPPFNDVRVRRALAYAIDKQNLLRAVYQDTAVEATGILPPSSWAYSDSAKSHEYAPDKARALLDEAGIDKLELDIWAMPVARIYNPNALKTAELIQADLATIGVKVNIVNYDWSVFTQKLARSDYDSVLIGWNADNSDPDNFFTPLLSCGSIASNNNRSRWCNPRFDALLNQARSVSDRESRSLLYHQAEAILAQDMPLVSLAHAKRMALKNASVTETSLTPFGGIAFANIGHGNKPAVEKKTSPAKEQN